MSLRIILFGFLVSVCGLSFAVKLESMVINAQQEKATVFCTMTNQPKYHVFTLNHPNRVVLDLEQSSTTLDLRQIKVGQGLVTGVRSGHPNAHTLRLVFDVRSTVKAQVSGKNSGFRIDLTSIGHIQPQLTKTHFTTPTVTRPMQVRQSGKRSSRDVIIVLDPGHGGKDPGAMGAHRHAEKDAVLAIALKLKDMINRQPGMRAVLTRNGDYYVGLRDRLNIARKYNADVFIAIHADAFIHQNSHGASVFALSQRGATSEAARWLAEKENYSELGGVNLSGLDDQNGMIRTVLLDLSQTATINAGLQMGSYMLQYLSQITVLHNSKVEQARFVVLKSPDIPSVLVETGFISNPTEERNLTSPQYQGRLAQAIFQGIKRYFFEHPIQGTHLEAMSLKNTHLLRAENRTSWFLGTKRRA